MNYPKIELATAVGPLVMTFMDDTPTADMLKNWRESHGPKPRAEIAHAHGRVVVNGIAVDVSMYFKHSHRWVHSDDGAARTAVPYLAEANSTYNRRVDGRAWQYDAGYAQKIRDAVPAAVEAALLANPELTAHARFENRRDQARRLGDEAAELRRKADKLDAEARELMAANAGEQAARNWTARNEKGAA